MGRVLYRVHDELRPPFRPWSWRLVERRLGGPTPEEWMARAAAKVLQLAGRRGVDPVSAPLTSVVHRRGRVYVTAEVLAWGPAGLKSSVEIAPVDVVDRADREGDA